MEGIKSLGRTILGGVGYGALLWVGAKVAKAIYNRIQAARGMPAATE